MNYDVSLRRKEIMTLDAKNRLLIKEREKLIEKQDPLFPNNDRSLQSNIGATSRKINLNTRMILRLKSEIINIENNASKYYDYKEN